MNDRTALGAAVVLLAVLAGALFLDRAQRLVPVYAAARDLPAGTPPEERRSDGRAGPPACLGVAALPATERKGECLGGQGQDGRVQWTTRPPADHSGLSGRPGPHRRPGTHG